MRRRYFTDLPAARRIIGEQGLALSDLAPHGLVRVHGEIWHARAADGEMPLRKNTRLRVTDIDGMELRVQALDSPSGVRSRQE